MISIKADGSGFTRNPEYYVMKHFSSFVPRGSTVHQLRGTCSANTVVDEAQ